MITITTTAAEQIRAAASQAGAEGLALRLAAKQQADGAIEYGMGFDEVRENDSAWNCSGVDLLVGEPSRALLAGTTLDFVEYEPGDYRFIFIPSCSSAPASGGCGSGGCSGCGK